jgi:hypothetical protein
MLVTFVYHSSCFLFYEAESILEGRMNSELAHVDDICLTFFFAVYLRILYLRMRLNYELAYMYVNHICLTFYFPYILGGSTSEFHTGK